MAGELLVGDRVELTFGPFASAWEVVEITDRGARCRFMAPSVRFVGFGRNQFAPDGTQLTADADQAFIGRAHFATAKKLSTRRKP